jgi:hypothetical protein
VLDLSAKGDFRIVSFLTTVKCKGIGFDRLRPTCAFGSFGGSWNWTLTLNEFVPV